MPFKSRAQWGWAFAAKQPWARRWAHKTKTPFKKLPKRVRRRKETADGSVVWVEAIAYEDDEE